MRQSSPAWVANKLPASNDTFLQLFLTCFANPLGAVAHDRTQIFVCGVKTVAFLGTPRSERHFMVRLTFMLCLAAMTLVGCGSSPEGQSPALQERIDAVLALQEMFATKTVSKTNLQSIKENSSQLADSETDQKKLVTLAEKLRKAKKGSDTIQSISHEMAALIPLPEKYARYRP